MGLGFELLDGRSTVHNWVPNDVQPLISRVPKTDPDCDNLYF